MLQGMAERLLMRFTSPVTTLAVSRDHTHLAAGSSDFNIKVLNLHERPSSGFSLADHDAPILCVAFDHQGEMLVSDVQ
jgi:WD40 repeat protein